VDARKPYDSSGYYALTFGQNKNEDAFEYYLFGVESKNGSYVLTRWAPDPDDVKSWSGTSDAIRPGTATNILMVERVGSQITLWINGELVQQVQDDMFTGDRLVGVATLIAQEVYFDNFSLFTYNRN
jgi:hypothetical protein